MSYKAAIKASLVGLTFAAITSTAIAAPKCGNTSAGFETWLEATKQEAAAKGVGKRALNALNNVHYAQATIITRGKAMKKQNAALFAKLEAKYGVASGPVIAIWGMETSFGSFMGKQHTLSAVATLAYDCRRSDFFTDQLYAALKLIDRGDFDPNSVGAMHGEIGQTQFLPKNVLLYGADGDGDGHIDMIHSKADALASTFNFLRNHGWKTGAGYQPGEPNFVAIQGWNDASVYQQSIAIMGKQIDGN